MSYSNSWYLAVDDVTAGPASTDLVIRGIEHHKVPPEALVCEVGAAAWAPLSSVGVFHAAVVRSYPPPPPDSEEAQRWMAQGFRFPPPAALPRFDEAVELTVPTPLPPPRPPPRRISQPSQPVMAKAPPSPLPPPSPPPRKIGAPVAPPARPAMAKAPPSPLPPPNPPPRKIAPSAASLPAPEPLPEDTRKPLADVVAVARPPETRPPPDFDFDVDWDDPPAATAEDAPARAVDWSDPFEPYFLVGDEVELPEEQSLLHSLSMVPPETFDHQEAMWNLALCLAYGSDEVAAAAAQAFFEAAGKKGGGDRVDWMHRTLLGNGFVPSGIPEEAGHRAVQRLRNSCPPSLTGRLS